MAKLINKYAESVMLRSVNRLINKYGHDVILHQERQGQPTMETPSKATFGRFKVSFGNNNLIINNNYKVRLRADYFPYTIQPLDSITVNGAQLNIVNARKITPDGAATVVWELECSGGNIPADANTAAVPSMLAPTNETSYYPATATVGDLSSATFTVSSFMVLSGESDYLSTEWQLASDGSFAELLDGGMTEGFTWVSDVVLENPMNYYIRARHNGSGDVQTAWSASTLFNLGLIGDVPVTDVYKPTFVWTTPITNGFIDPSYTYAYEYAPYGPWKVYPVLSAFGSDTGKLFGNTRWQFAKDAAFTDIVWAGDSTGGYDYDQSTVFDYNVLVMNGFKLPDGVDLYMRAKYVADDATESEWSDTVVFKINGNRPAQTGTVVTPTIPTTINATTKYMVISNVTYKKTMDGVTKYKVYPMVSTFSGTGGEIADRAYWQLSTDPTFATGMIYDGEVRSTYDLATNKSVNERTFWMPTHPGPFPLDLNVTYYIRVKWIAASNTESAWSPVREFKIDPAT